MFKLPKNWLLRSPLQAYIRNCSSTAANSPVNEQLILDKLRGKFPKAATISVEDTSGGCGAMFNVSVETPDFQGLSVMKQHKLVYETLKDEMTKIHGLHLQTRISK
ncbi:unnamed protein product [Phyllotreta striolata]|uniref:BolA-like protein 3 n=1 Tax=Phyllotreta striolata TaxID=444603 RepID=A0A9N9XQR4_PHYSR|nr:unnamed protein product [Phyllotreta striolata]